MTSIEWTDRTWNPIRGCSRVSEGCRNCYAERIAARFSLPGNTFHGFAERGPDGPRWTGQVTLLQDKLTEPLTWKKPARVFVNSMSDLFHENLPDEAIDRVFAVMAWTPWHTYQVLTKRAERMRHYFEMNWHRRVFAVYYQMRDDGIATIADDFELQRSQGRSIASITCGLHNERFLPNVWLGVSVENQHFADERIPLLLQTPAAVRFVSYEPALGPVDFTSIPIAMWRQWPSGEHEQVRVNALESREHFVTEGSIEWPALDWIICGGESGAGARPFDLAWARSIVQQCKATGVACFVKQLGASPWDPDRIDEKLGYVDLRDKKGGDPAEWPEDLRVREFPEVRA